MPDYNKREINQKTTKANEIIEENISCSKRANDDGYNNPIYAVHSSAFPVQ